ncbi:ABC transporter permease [Hoeflea sp. WL0058]|uniref:ABC transporter permease n=1 Tax=Flavimaribacter sediminis TaxID=2865987 RepID=A0AAE2ZJX5_9HYPH|nr:ABC transporter permease [Flavimaribacter sediminis]MBW8637349.1 ABC transporter permease [Flavimaribacter sediminis]
MNRAQLVIAFFFRLPPIVWALLLTVAFGALYNPQFRTVDNAMNVLEQSATLAFLALGQAFVIAGGLIDLSVGQLVGLVTVVACMGFEALPGWRLPVILGCLLLGAAVGMINGTLINHLRMPPLILTFGMLSVLQGCIFMLTDRSVGSSIPAIDFLAHGRIAGIPASLILVILATVIAFYCLQRSTFGWHLLAMGNNASASRKAGLNVRGLTLIAYSVSGFFAAIAGLVLAGRLGTGFPNAGSGLELDSIVAVVLGGTPLKGGRVNVVAVLAAVFFLGTVSNLLNLMQVPTFTQILIKGIIVIVAILLERPRWAAAPQ